MEIERIAEILLMPHLSDAADVLGTRSSARSRPAPARAKHRRENCDAAGEAPHSAQHVPLAVQMPHTPAAINSRPCVDGDCPRRAAAAAPASGRGCCLRRQHSCSRAPHGGCRRHRWLRRHVSDGSAAAADIPACGCIAPAPAADARSGGCAAAASLNTPSSISRGKHRYAP